MKPASKHIKHMYVCMCVCVCVCVCMYVMTTITSIHKWHDHIKSEIIFKVELDQTRIFLENLWR